MDIKIKKTIGKTDFEFDILNERDDFEALVKASQVAMMPTKCGLCGSENITLSSNKGKTKDGGEVTFLKVICHDCNARSQVGQYKSGGTFWKNWEKYQAPLKGE